MDPAPRDRADPPGSTDDEVRMGAQPPLVLVVSRVNKINLAKNDGVELVTKMTQETQSFPNLVQADPRGGATFPSAARGRMATDDGAAARSYRGTYQGLLATRSPHGARR